MVKIIEKSPEEREKEKRFSDLEKITKEHLNDSNINIRTFEDSFIGLFLQSSEGSYDKSIIGSVFPEYKKILLNKPEYFEKLLGLAEKYEKTLNEKWTLKQNY